MTDLLDVIAELGEQERAVLLVLARRLLAGQLNYGRLDLARDLRDWWKERAAELADALVYGAIAEVAATLERTAVDDRQQRREAMAVGEPRPPDAPKENGEW